MSSISTLNAQSRERAGKGAARAARRNGLVPAVIYGGKKPPQMVSIDPKALHREMNSRGFFARQVELDIQGDKHRVLPRDVQFHPVNDAPLHVDFLRVTEDTRVTVNVAVIFLNEEDSPGLKRGGVLNVVRHEIEINASVANIPEQFEVDLTGLDIGDSVHISAIGLPEGVVPTITDRDFTVATIAAPSVIEEAEPGEEGEDAEGVEEGEDTDQDADEQD